MASTSESGHAKNIANFNLLITHINAIGPSYNPSNIKLLIPNLQSSYTNAFNQQQIVNTLVAPYSFAVDEREVVFKPVSKTITKLRKAYKATQGVTPVELNDFMTIARKIKGIRKTAITPSENPEDPQVTHSASQLSYDQRTNNMDLLISLLQNTPNYSPNEVEFQVATFQALKTQMMEKTQAVANTFIPLNNARSTRNTTIYYGEDSLFELGSRAKDYVFSILDVGSAQYKAIARIKFKKPKQ